MPLAAEIALPLAVGAYSFLVDRLAQPPQVGARLIVPWRNEVYLGLVLSVHPVSSADAYNLREAITLVDHAPFLHPDDVLLLQWAAERYSAPVGTLLRLLVPTGLEEPLERRFQAVSGISTQLPPLAARLVEQLAEEKPLEALEPLAAEAELKEMLSELRDQGVIIERTRLAQSQQRYLALGRPADASLTAKQRQVLDTLEQLGEAPSAAALARVAGVGPGVVQRLIELGLVAGHTRPPAAAVAYPRYAPAPSAASPVEPAVLQSPEVAAWGGSAPERYALAAASIDLALAQGQGALCLLPEGALLERAFYHLAGRYREQVALLHGNMRALERVQEWERLRSGQARVVFGTYLALLAPLPQLGLVVVEEEGSDAHKLRLYPYPFMPELALERAKRRGSRLLTLAAAPAVETYYRASTGLAQLHRLSTPLPRCRVIDLRHEPSWPLGRGLVQALTQVQERGRQAIVLSPRRAYAAVLVCQDCDWTARCQHCEVSLRYYKEQGVLRCHQCGFVQTLERCPSCQGTLLEPRGPGTGWILEQLRQLLGDFPAARYDADHRDTLGPLYAGAPGVVACTTAILAVPPLPKLSLIAHTLLDTTLSISDFRAGERLYRLLCQLGELAGARRPLMVLQTYQPGHPAVQAFATGQLEPFFSQELATRQHFRYPPYGELARIVLSGRDQARVAEAAEALGRSLRHWASAEELLGPAPAPVPKLRNQYLWHLILRATDASRLRELVAPASRSRPGVRIAVDIHPRQMVALPEERP
ncbi:MAG: primosomal protein N' [Deinococcus sp.]|nr:primosomal protein N' [Deinococcus sp.]